MYEIIFKYKNSIYSVNFENFYYSILLIDTILFLFEDYDKYKVKKELEELLELMMKECNKKVRKNIVFKNFKIKNVNRGDIWILRIYIIQNYYYDDKKINNIIKELKY